MSGTRREYRFRSSGHRAMRLGLRRVFEMEAAVDRKPAASDLLARRVHYDLPGMDAVRVRRDVAYTLPADAESTMDVYSPPGRTASERTPAVVLVSGFPGAVKRIGSFVSWAELMAASGLVAITCATKEPVTDMQTVLGYVREHAASLGIDGNRMGLWACSGHVPNALSILDGSTAVADAAKQYGFANPGSTTGDVCRSPSFTRRRTGCAGRTTRAAAAGRRSWRCSFQFRNAGPQRDEGALRVPHGAYTGGGHLEEALGAASPLRRGIAERGRHEPVPLQAIERRVHRSQHGAPSARPFDLAGE